MLLPDKVAIITGGASPLGIGFATAKAFAEAGAKVVIVDLDGTEAAGRAAELGPDHIGLSCDVRDPAACDAVAQQALARYGRLDVLANIAGVSQPHRLMDATQADYDIVMDVSVRGTYNMARAVVPPMRAQRSGSIICTGSVAAQRGGGLFGGPHYAAAKGAVQTLAKAMARELAPDGIRVNAIAPGMVETGLFAGRLSEEQRQKNAAAIPLGRVAVPDDIAQGFLFLASDMSRYITGVVLDINGGSHIH